MKVKSESEVSQPCLTLSNPMDCSLPGSSAHGIFQARVLEMVYISKAILLSHREVVGREMGGGFMFGIACTSVVDSCQCMAKLIQYCKVK